MKLKKIAFSYFFLTCVIVTLVTPLYHSLEENHVDYCNANNVEHVCNHNVKEQVQPFTVDIGLIKNFEYKFATLQTIILIDYLKEDFLPNYQKLSFSLRAPPC